MDDASTMLELMVVNAESSTEVDLEDVKRWQKLFGMFASQAHAAIKKHRGDINRIRVSDELWETVKIDLHPDHDKESYEHSLQIQQETALRPSQPSSTPPNSRWLVQAQKPITVGLLRQMIHQEWESKVYIGTNESGESSVWARIDGRMKDRITERFPTPCKPIFARDVWASKELSSTTVFPKLGIDSTLPQFKTVSNERASPQQDEYPVWYFFYGILADSAELKRMLDLDSEPELEDACIFGGTIKMWENKYKALIDGSSTDKVNGWAYMVRSQEHEERLRAKETDKYEVARCDIHTQTGLVEGLTFRFADASMLS